MGPNKERSKWGEGEEGGRTDRKRKRRTRERSKRQEKENVFAQSYYAPGPLHLSSHLILITL